MEVVKEVATWFGIIGAPAIFTIAIWCITQVKRTTGNMLILMHAVQVQMKETLLEQYHFYISRGYIEDDDMDRWEEQYKAYHQLGKNGVMDSRREELLKLPSKPTFHN